MLAIILSYMLRLPEGEDQAIQDPLQRILKITPALMEMLLDSAREVAQGIMQGQIPPTKMSSMGLLNMVEFSQNMT
jgi:hypothetical protein